MDWLWLAPVLLFVMVAVFLLLEVVITRLLDLTKGLVGQLRVRRELKRLEGQKAQPPPPPPASIDLPVPWGRMAKCVGCGAHGRAPIMHHLGCHLGQMGERETEEE